MGAGRPTTYKPEYCDMVIEHMSEGASLSSFAARIHCARSTINEWMSKNPEFSDAVKIAKASCAAWWESVARHNAVSGDGNATLCIFGLKNMAPDDWREKQELKVDTNINFDVNEIDNKLRELGINPDDIE